MQVKYVYLMKLKNYPKAGFIEHRQHLDNGTNKYYDKACYAQKECERRMQLNKNLYCWVEGVILDDEGNRLSEYKDNVWYVDDNDPEIVKKSCPKMLNARFFSANPENIKKLKECQKRWRKESKQQQNKQANGNSIHR